MAGTVGRQALAHTLFGKNLRRREESRAIRTPRRWGKKFTGFLKMRS